MLYILAYFRVFSKTGGEVIRAYLQYIVVCDIIELDIKRIKENIMNEDKLNIENTKAQMRKGLLEFCILQIISKGKIYASDILKKLKEADLIVVEGTIYPLLSRLKNYDLLDYSWEESKSGPPRKYYTITSKGQKSLEALKQAWEDISKSIKSLYK